MLRPLIWFLDSLLTDIKCFDAHKRKMPKEFYLLHGTMQNFDFLGFFYTHGFLMRKPTLVGNMKSPAIWKYKKGNFRKWYFVTKIVVTYCVKKNVLVIEKNFWNSRLKAENWQNIWDHLEQFIQTVKGLNNFWRQIAFLTCSWRFLISDKLEQSKFKLEKIIAI